jgi:phosphatidate cytidylyltransferase
MGAVYPALNHEKGHYGSSTHPPGSAALTQGILSNASGGNGIGGRTCFLGIPRHCRLPAIPTHVGSDRHRSTLRRNLLSPAVILPALGLCSLVLVLVCSFGLPIERVLRDSAFSIFPLLYIGLTLVTLPLLWVQPNGPSLLIFLFCIVWTGDTAALYVGRNLGRHKLAPQISPNKSWEGSAGSLAGSLLIAVLLFFLSRWGESGAVLHYPGPLTRWLAMAALLNVFAQVGDLVESAIKRGAGVKDSGAMLPGHGGILDRIDALLLAAPALWYAQWIQLYFERASLR